MNARRLKLVKLAFLKIDKDRSGILDLNDVKGVYNARAHPDVMSGRRTEDEVLVEFINNFKIGGEKDGVVTPKEFEDYYANISASIDDDDYFELMMRNSWHISGGEGWCANTTNKRVLVTHDDGTQTVEEVKNDIGISSRDTDGMMRQLRSQGINAKTINTAGTSDMHNAKENNRGSNYSYVEDDRTAPMPQRLGEFANSYSRDNRAQRDSQRPSSTNKGGAYYKPQSLSEMIVNGNVPVTNQPRATSRGGYRR